MTWAYALASAAALAVAGFTGWAASLPAEATASRTALIAAPVERVFALATDVAGQAAWRRDVARVEVAPGGAEWVEHTRQGLAIAFREERREPGLYAIAFASPQGFSGRWEGRFAAEAGATRVEVVETVRTEGLIARAMARFFAPAGAHVDLWLQDLAAAAARGA